jgi:CheY-like chemotaxis protein
MGQRLLLVDSDRTFLKEHQVSLEAAFDLETSTSPEGVVSSLEHGHHAAVLICVEVSDNKGYALCSTIRKNPKLAAVKVGLISAKATDEEYRRHQSLKGRADLYLHKPIAPSALVAALTPLVPGRALDPDNPLGELVDTELGDDWLDNLKSTLDEGVASPPRAAKPEPTFAVRSDEPVITRHLDATSTAPPDTTRARLLEEQVAALHEELRAKDKRLQETVSELAQLKSQLSAVTVNLDDLDRRSKESESLAQQLSEKTLRTDELLKERDRLQLQTLEMDQLLEKTQELEKALADKQTALDEK